MCSWSVLNSLQTVTKALRVFRFVACFLLVTDSRRASEVRQASVAGRGREEQDMASKRSPEPLLQGARPSSGRVSPQRRSPPRGGNIARVTRRGRRHDWHPQAVVIELSLRTSWLRSY